MRLKKKYKIAISMSGGVDSSISTFLMRKNLFCLETFYIKSWNNNIYNTCNTNKDVLHVKNICKQLNIKLHILDYSNLYWNIIFLDFLKELKLGLTPNPDILCNKKIKFSIFLYYVIFLLKFDLLATGHYSRIIKKKKNFFLCDNFDFLKNQNYFLSDIKLKVRRYIFFPLSNYTKTNIRHMIRYINFSNFNKKSSIGICFIGEKNFNFFLSKYIKPNIGDVLDDNNICINKHIGIFFYTIGQKFVSKKKSNFFIISKNKNKNQLYVTTNKKLLFCNKLKIKNITFKVSKNTQIFLCKTRHCTYTNVSTIFFDKKKNNYYIFFKKKEKITAPGQLIVFYKNNICLGTAKISN